jgi:hypothetical protein
MTTEDFNAFPAKLKTRLSRLVRSRTRFEMKLTRKEWETIFADFLDTAMELGDHVSVPLYPDDDRRKGQFRVVGFYGSTGPRGGETYIARRI